MFCPAPSLYFHSVSIVIGLSRQSSHEFDENKQVDYESIINFPRLFGKRLL